MTTLLGRLERDGLVAAAAIEERLAALDPAEREALAAALPVLAKLIPEVLP
jgi:hypothetical protein